MDDPKEIVKSGYNAMASGYLAARTQYQDSADIPLIQELVERLPKGAKVLDAGCGPGVPVTRLLSQSFEVTGVDVSEAQIELARQLVPQARFLCQDMTELSFPDGHFDAICSYYAIIHVPREDHRQLLLNFHRMLRQQGLALLCLGAGDLAGGTEEDFFGAPMYWSHYDSATNLKMVEECGFQVIFSKLVDDFTVPKAKHLFVLAQSG